MSLLSATSASNLTHCPVSQFNVLGGVSAEEEEILLTVDDMTHVVTQWVTRYAIVSGENGDWEVPLTGLQHFISDVCLGW